MLSMSFMYLLMLFVVMLYIALPIALVACLIMLILKNRAKH